MKSESVTTPNKSYQAGYFSGTLFVCILYDKNLTFESVDKIQPF